MGQAWVSVIIPTYNSGSWIERAVSSTLEQDLPDIEILVVDDGSSDNTQELMRAFNDPRVVYERFADNRGVHEARNLGIELARGNILTFLDADDELVPLALHRCVDTFEDLPDDVGILLANGITEEGELTGPALESARFLSIRELMCGTAFRARKGCFAAVRRSCVGDIRWVLPGFDFVFWRRLERRWRTFALNQVFMRYHTEDNPASLSALRSVKDKKYLRAASASQVYEEFVSEMKEELRSWCPQSYADYLWGLAVTSLLAGRRKIALATGLEMLRYRRDRRTLALPVLALVPRILTREIYLRG